MSEHIGYKKCRGDRIVKLEIMGKNNENRKDIIDKKYAKYRCSRAKVLDIYDMHDRSIKYNDAIGLYDSDLIYRIGEIVEPNNGFESKLEKVCSSGIHYFLTEKPAFFWDYIPTNGEYKSWYDNGRIFIDCTYKNGEYDGSYKTYYENGKIWEECTYIDMRLDGLHRSHNESGQIEWECTYEYGKIMEK